MTQEDSENNASRKPLAGGFATSTSSNRASTVAPACYEERHYAVAEVAELWSISKQVVRKLFEREPGVMVIGGTPPRGKRRYRTLRIPQSVAERVHRRLCNPCLTVSRTRA